MNGPDTIESLPDAKPLPRNIHPPLFRAPEEVHHIFGVTIFAACLPLLAGVVVFGWRAAGVAILSIVSCAAIERVYFHVTHTPAMLGRSHAYLTGVLLALMLPPFTPWYVVILAAAFAIIIGKAIFGGVGHFLWQPALVGRFAIAVIVPVLISPTALQPDQWGLLAPKAIILGDVENTGDVGNYRGWRQDYTYKDSTTGAVRDRLEGRDGFALEHPVETLAPLTRGRPAYSSLATVERGVPGRKPAALAQMPPIGDMISGARPGGIGETSALLILIAGLYLVYRNYVKWQLPLAFLASAAVVAAVTPIQLAGPNQTVNMVYLPLLSEGFDVGFTYVSYQILTGQMLLAAFFLATEMTSCPVTTGGQVIFGIGCGAGAMVLQLYLNTPIPAYIAVLAMNTLVPTIDSIWRPRVFGQKFFQRR